MFIHYIRHGKRLTFTSIVTGLVLLVLVICNIGISASYIFIHFQYQHGQVDTESAVNADIIADKLEEHPDWLLTNPALEQFVQEDVAFKESDWYETRAIVAIDGQKLFVKKNKEPLSWPVVSQSTPIEVDGKKVGDFVIARSLTHLVYESLALFIFSVFCSALTIYLLHRFVLRRLRWLEEDLSRNARFDSLTGLPNRCETLKELQRRLDVDKLGSTAVFFIDLDKFKSINDSYGHAFGDQVLKSSASRMRSCIRPEDFLGRLSGDEFIIILNVSISDGEAVIKRIAESVCHAFLLPHICQAQEVAITATVGVAVAPVHGNQAEQLIQCADTAMYALKLNYPGGWKTYDPAMTEKVDREVQLRKKLKQALQRDEFELHYQPLLRLHDNQAIGAEALIRWRDPDSGRLVPPLDFIPELERSGLIVPVGEWVLRTACRQVLEWRRTVPDFYIAVNVSARQFMEDGFVDSVARILLEEKVEPDSIEIELTESMLLDDEVAIRILAGLKNIGVSLSLDDFGTGFSSLGRLASMPFDVIKIDRQFINQMNVGERQRSVVVSITALTHGLGMTVLAEGIEEKEQCQALVELGCDRGQGFLFCRPIPAEDFNALYISCSGLASQGTLLRIASQSKKLTDGLSV